MSAREPLAFFIALRNVSLPLLFFWAVIVFLVSCERQPVNEPVGFVAPASLGVKELVQRPPKAHRANHIMVVKTIHYAKIEQFCALKTGRPKLACADIGGTVWLPNPCDYKGYYAQLACHEFAHAQGWPADHSGMNYGVYR